MVQVASTADGTASTPTPREGLSARVRTLDVVLVVAVVVAALVRIWHLDSSSLWYDEFVTADDIGQRLAHMVLVSLPQNEGSPPLYFLLAWGWVRVFGAGDGALRSLSALIGIATVPVVYLLALELRLRRTVARIAAFLVAVNPLFVWYSQEARPYALLVLLGAVSILCCVRAVNDPKTSNFVWWGIAAAAAVSTHYFAVLIVAPEIVWLAYATRSRLRKLAWGCLPLVVVGIPLLKLANDQQSRNQAWIGDFHIGLRLAEAGRSALLGPPEPFDSWWPLVAALLALAAIAAAVVGNRHERRTALIMAALGLSGIVLALAAAVVGTDYILGRNLIVSMIPFIVIVAIGCGTQRMRVAGLVLAVALCLGWTGAVVRSFRDADLQKADWRAVAHIVDRGPEARAVVVDSYLGAPMLRYIPDSRTLQPHKSAKVDAIDLVYRIPPPGHRCGRWSGLGCEAFLFPRMPKSLAGRFALVDRVERAGFVVNRYRAQHAVPVSEPLLVPDARVLRGFVLLPNDRLRTYRISSKKSR